MENNMFKFSNVPLNVSGLIKNSFASYSTVMQTTWQLILVSGLLSLLSNGAMKLNLYVGSAITVLIILAIIFIYAVILHLSNTVLSGKEGSLKNSMAIAKKRYLSLLWLCDFVDLVLLIAVNLGVDGRNIDNIVLTVLSSIALFSLFLIYLIIFVCH
jgi:hypothetical protein